MKFCLRFHYGEGVEVTASAFLACVGACSFGSVSAVEAVCICNCGTCFWFSFLDQSFCVGQEAHFASFSNT